MSTFRSLLAALLVVALGCASPSSASNSDKVSNAAELTVLDQLVGTWQSRAKVSGSLVRCPAYSGTEQPVLESTVWAAWALRGKFLRTEGVHHSPDGTETRHVHYITWHPTKRRYRTWLFNSDGAFGEGWMRWVPGERAFYSQAETYSDGQLVLGHGVIVFVDDTNVEWTWTEESSEGRIHVEGTRTRISPLSDGAPQVGK